MLSARWASALVCEPARADYYAFASTEHLSDATLRLTVGDTTVNINTGGFQGWFSTTSVFHIPGNSNYVVGEYNNTSYNDYFGFDLSSLPATATVSSAELVVDSGVISDKLNFILFGATQWIGQLQGGSNPDLYNELATGPEYSRTVISANTDPTALLTSSAQYFGGCGHQRGDPGPKHVRHVRSRRARFGPPRRFCAGARDMDPDARRFRWTGRPRPPPGGETQACGCGRPKGSLTVRRRARGRGRLHAVFFACDR